MDSQHPQVFNDRNARVPLYTRVEWIISLPRGPRYVLGDNRLYIKWKTKECKAPESYRGTVSSTNEHCAYIGNCKSAILKGWGKQKVKNGKWRENHYGPINLRLEWVLEAPQVRCWIRYPCGMQRATKPFDLERNPKEFATRRLS